MPRERVWFDCDPGHDDAAAILLALANPDRFDIVGFSTVCGNALLVNTTRNLNHLLSYVDHVVAIHAGASHPLIVSADPQSGAHGISGMDGFHFENESCPVDDDAIVALKDACLNNEEPLTIFALGPLTNIALLIRTYPQVISHIKQVIIMGGAIYGGNMLACSEFNLYGDPHAAKIVFDMGDQMPIVLAPLEVCKAGATPLNRFDAFKSEGKLNQMLDGLFTFYCRYAIDRHMDRTPIFDMLTVAYALDPSRFKWMEHPIDIITEGEHTRGMSVVLQQVSNAKNVRVLHDCDGQWVNDTFFDSMHRLNAMLH